MSLHYLRKLYLAMYPTHEKKLEILLTTDFQLNSKENNVTPNDQSSFAKCFIKIL